MRIGWATPFNERSAIARYSRAVCHEIERRGSDVEIIRVEIAESAELPPLATRVPVHAPETAHLSSMLYGFDLIVANVGDHFLYHGRVLEILTQVPAVVVFHDSDLTNFMNGLLLREGAFRSIIEPFRQTRPPRTSDDEKALYLSLLASVSGGSVAHGAHYLEPVRAACPGPVGALSLCYPDVGSIAPKPSSGGDIIVVTFGMINENKQAARVLKAIAKSAARDRIVYRLIGPIEAPREFELKRIARELGIRPPETFGWVPDGDLFSHLSQAHAICCLRYPITEGGSASLISALYSARPVIVADAGAYAEVPDGLVTKVPYGTSVDELAAAIDAVAANPLSFDRMAQAARTWAVREYSAQTYVDRLLPLMEEAISCGPAIRAGRVIGASLSSMGIPLGDPAVGRIGRAVAELLSPQRA
jgi:glycosyltransferase involved in cell wall biosynthesis